MAALYLAAPLFTDAERAWNLALGARLRAALAPAEVLLPQEFCAPCDPPAGGRPDYAAIHAACVAQLARARAVLAVLDGPDVDSGTAWECGWACARGIPVVGLRTDWRPGEDGAGNCMLTRSCRAVVRGPEAAIAALAALLGGVRPASGCAP